MTLHEQTNETYKIFLTNGFKYEGSILSDENGFILLKDSKGKEIRICKTAITVIEPFGGDC